MGTRSFLLGDFHVRLAGCLGHSLLADTRAQQRDALAQMSRAAQVLHTSPRTSAAKRRKAAAAT